MRDPDNAVVQMLAMAQIKVYGIAERLDPVKARMWRAIHACVVEALEFPVGKRAHRCFPMARGDFYIPAARAAPMPTIIEISMFEGRTRRKRRP